MAPSRNQGDAAVAHDGGARHVTDLAVVGFEVLHHHLLLAEQLVHQQRHAHALGLDHHHDVGHVLEVEARHVEHALQFDHRHVLLAHLHHAARCRRWCGWPGLTWNDSTTEASGRM
jgi:hypothetical protein